MSFIAKNPLTIPKVASAPPTPQEGARGLFAGDDGWYDIDSDGNVKKIALSDDNISYADCDNDLKTRIDYSLYDDHFVAPTPQEDFVITYRSIDNTASIHAYVGNDTDIVVPYICYKDGAAYIVTALQPESFQNHDTIVSVALPNTITRIDAGAFLGCSNLSSINIPNGVNLIAGRMFSGCESLTSIIIPANVRAIAPLAFYGCTNLATITMPGDISVVGDEAFWGCHALTTVYYNGNKKQWSEMTVGDDNDAFLEATIVYSMRDYALSDDLEDVRRQLSRVYKPKGSWTAIDGVMPSNNEVGDVWNLTNTLNAEEMRFGYISNNTITVPTNHMSYSRTENNSHYTHTFSILIPYEEFPAPPDTNYKMINSGIHSSGAYGISITMEDIAFDDIPYETWHIVSQPSGYEVVFTEPSASSTSEFETVASTARTITQVKVPYTNTHQILAGSNIVWVEPGYWDVLSGIVDLSGYVLTKSVVITDKNYSGNYIQHSKDINISTKKAENLVTAGEVDSVLSTEIEKINNKIGGIFHYKGSCELSDLPSANNVVGDVWNISGVSATSGIQIEVDTDTPFSNFTCDYNYNEEEAEPSHQFQLNLPLNTFNHIPLADGQDEPDNYTSLIDEDVVVIFGNGMTFSWLIDSLLNVGTHLSINFEAEDGESVGSVWSQIHEAKTQDPTLEIEHISIPYKYIGAVKTGDNVVWAEPGYWDTLSNSVDLSSYVTKDSTDVITNKAYAGNYIKHMTEIKIDNKTANNLVTADEVDSALSTEITRINNLLGSVFHYKGTCAAYDLPTSNNVVGDVWNISKDSPYGVYVNITSSSFVIPYGNVDYNVELENGVYHHTFWFNFDFSDIDYIGDKPGWVFDRLMFEEIRVKVHNYEPLKYEEEPGDSMEPVVDVRIEINEREHTLALTFSADSDSSTYSNWQEMYSSGTAAGLPIDFVITPYISDAFEAGSNVVWAEPGYWDVLSPFIDLSNYVTKTSYANSSVGGVVKVESNTHGLNMDSGTLKISPATAAEISLKANGYKPVVPAQIENAVTAGTHQDMSDNYGVGNKGNLPASYAAVKGYVDSSITNISKGLDDLEGITLTKRSGVAGDFSNGYINGSGELVTYAKSLCSVRFFNYNADNILRVITNSNYKFTIFAWDASGVYQGYLTTEGTFQKTGGTVARVQEFDFTSYKSYYIRLGVTNPISGGYEDITPSEATNITFVCYDDYSKITNVTGLHKIKKATGSWTDKTGQIYYSLQQPSVRAVSIVEITTPCTVVFNPGSGKIYYRIYNGTVYNATQSVSAENWITNSFNMQITDTPKVVVAQFANMDGTTPVDIETFDGFMAISNYSSSDNYSLYGKRLSVIGDSIASFTGYISPGSTAYYPRSDVTRWQEMFWGVLASRNNMVVDVIDAYAGSCVADKWQSLERVSFIDNTRLSRLGTPDYIIVEGGINDFGGNPLGDYPAGSYTNMYEFRTAYSYLLNELKQRYPDAKIVCLSLMTARTYNNTQFPEKQTEVIQSQATDTTPHYLYEFNASIKEIAARYECIFCDISDVMNYYVSSTLGVHPEAAGHLAIAKRIEALIK